MPDPTTSAPFAWYEFFAGGGMARLGLGQGWRCTFANEWCGKKAAAYVARFGRGEPKRCRELRVEDIAALAASDLPGQADLAWASFPCQDLSLAGAGAGLAGKRSGTFHAFRRLIDALAREGRAPRTVVLENVPGALTSHGGQDFARIAADIAATGYRLGALIMDAARFLPHSRPRLFLVAVRHDSPVPASLVREGPGPEWHTAAVRNAFRRLPASLRQAWLWWNPPPPPPRGVTLDALIEENPAGVEWHSPEYTRRLIGLMSETNRAKLREAQALGLRHAGTVYRRTRPFPEGGRQRAEVRFDGVSGCLRTPAGGSSRQTILLVEGPTVRSRLLSPREAARLMGVPDDYLLPVRYNEAYHLLGDGLAVPVVAWLERHLLGPLARAALRRAAA